MAKEKPEKTQNKMSRQEAIAFLEEEGVIEGEEQIPIKYTQQEEEQIAHTMKFGGYVKKPEVKEEKSGKLFGDPCGELY